MNDIAITRAEVITLQPGDLLVFRFDGHLTQQEHAAIRSDLAAMWEQANLTESIKWVICDKSMNVEVMRAEAQ